MMLCKNFFYPILFIIFVWLFPALYSIFFPFETNLTTNWYLVICVLFLFFISIILPVFYLTRRSYYDFFSDLSSFRHEKIVLFLAFAAFFFQVIDIIFLRGISLNFNLHDNRAALENSSTHLTFVLIALLPFVYFSILCFFEKKGSIYLVPFFCVSIVYLISGNRQFFVFGLILLFVMQFMIRPFFSKKTIFRTFLVATLLIISMFYFQFQRQPYAEGEQLQFIYRIANIECEGFLCQTIFETPLAYLYLYFGIQFSGLSSMLKLSFDHDYVQAPLFSETIPVIYRRLESFFNLPEQSVVHMNMYDSFGQYYNIFPHFWRTMFGNFIFEYGFYGIFLLIFLIIFFGFFHILIFLKIKSRFSFFILSVFYSSMIFGIMFFPLFEPALFFLFLYLFVYSVIVVFLKVFKNSNFI